MKRILVTGASGFLGWNFTLWARNAYQVTGASFSHALEIEGVNAVMFDVRSQKEVIAALSDARPQIVFHFAALSRVEPGEKARGLAIDLNVTATDLLAAQCAQRGIRLVYVSTDLVFDGTGGGYRETDAPNPLSIYGKTKLEGEQRIRERGGDWLICRMASMYGPDNGTNACFATWMRERFEKGVEVPLYIDQYRCFLYVHDAVRALCELAEHSDGGELYHIGGGQRTNRVEYGKAYASAFGYDKSLIREISIHQDGKGHLRGADCSLDSSKTQEILSFPLKGIQQGIERWKAAAGGAFSDSTGKD